LSVISAQTPSAFAARENRYALFRIMRQFHSVKNGEFKDGELRAPPEAYGLNRRKSVSK
jgi:hypothetical protein